MKTQCLHEPSTTSPCLDRVSDVAGLPEHVEIACFPFTVGRGDTADLRIESTRVSREHAVFRHADDVICLEDLNSTNGTHVNGRRIQKATLQNGDMIAFADVEMAFRWETSSVSSKNVTQVLRSEETVPEPVVVRPSRNVLQLRRLHELVTQRCVSNLYRPIRNLGTEEYVGCEFEGNSFASADVEELVERSLKMAHSRLLRRVLQLQRMVAAEEFSNVPAKLFAILRLYAAELVDPTFVDDLYALRERLDLRQQLVMELPARVLEAEGEFQSIHARLRDRDVSVAYGGISASFHAWDALEQAAPEYLLLDPAVVQRSDRGSQAQKQFENLVQRGREADCQVIATGVQSAIQADLCQQFDCQLASGEFFSSPVPIRDLASFFPRGRR